MDFTKLPLSIMSKLKDFGVGVTKGVGTLAETPGYLADLITKQKFAVPPGTMQKSQQWQQMTTPTNKAQSMGHAVGSLSPGTEMVTPGLKKIGVNPMVAMGVGLGIDVLTPGGKAKAAKLLNRLDDLILKGDKTGDLLDLRAILTDKELVKQDLDFVEGVLNNKINLNKIGEDIGFTSSKLSSNVKRFIQNKTSGKMMGTYPKESFLLSEARKYKSPEEFVSKMGNKIPVGYDWKYLDEMKQAKKDGFAYSHSDFAALSNLEKANRGTGVSETFYRAGEIGKDGDVWLTPQKAGAEQYAKSGGTKIGEYKVATQNPLILNDITDIEKIVGKTEGKNFVNNPDLKQKVIDYAKKKGYDSVQFPDSFPDGKGGMKSLVVFDKSKIYTKSQLIDIWNKAHR